MGIVLWEMHLGVMDVHILAFQPFNQERRFGYWRMMCSCRKKRKRGFFSGYPGPFFFFFFWVMWNKIFVIDESCQKRKKSLMISRKRIRAGGGGGGGEGSIVLVQYNTNIYNNTYNR